MHQENRLPKNGKEGALYGAIIVTLSVLTIGSINMILAAGGFNKDVAMRHVNHVTYYLGYRYDY